jgi:hypothetical protein
MSYTYGPVGVTKVNGTTFGVTNMDIGITDPSGSTSLGQVISTGVGKEIGAFKILVQGASDAAVNLCGTQTTDPYTGVVTPGTNGSYTTINSETQTGAVVDQILKILAQKVTILAYQVGCITTYTGVPGTGTLSNTNQISVIFEQTAAWSAANYTISGGTYNGNTGPYNDYNVTVLGLQQAITTSGPNGNGTNVGVNGTNISTTVVYNAGVSAQGVTFGSGQFGSSIQLG